MSSDQKASHSRVGNCIAGRLFSLFVCLAICGCSPVRQTDYSQIDLVEVTGQVSLDGVPLYNALVVFESEDFTSSSGVTNHQGEYRLMFNSEKSGCTPGQKIVRITISAGEESEDPDAILEGVAEIPSRYNRESELTADVSNVNTRFDFDLTTGE